MIRKAEIKDIPRVLELLVQVDMVHHEGRPDLFKGPATKYTADELLDIFADAQRPVFVSTDDDDCVEGYAFCVLQRHVDDNVLTDVTTLYIDDLCVDEKLRGRHIGRHIYEYVLTYARQIGCYNVTLNVWSANASAAAFYEHMGLKPQKTTLETIL